MHPKLGGFEYNSGNRIQGEPFSRWMRPPIMNDDKRHYRQMKRDIKKAGNRKRRQHLKRDLALNPEEAAKTEFDLGRDASAPLNGNDKDSTRRRQEDEEE